MCVSTPSTRRFQSKEEVREFFASEYAPNAGFKIKKKGQDDYEFELEDKSRLELIKYVVSKLGNKRFIFARDFSEFGSFITNNQEDFFLSIATQPDLVKESFNLITELNIARAKICIDEGVDAIMPGGDFSDSHGPMVSPESIRKIFLPGMKKLSVCYGSRYDNYMAALETLHKYGDYPIRL